MISNKVSPVNLLVLYSWEALKNNTSMQLINGLIPIAALTDEPRLSDSDQPYLVYGYSEQNQGEYVGICTGYLSFRISARTMAQMTEIITALAESFQWGADSAVPVNAWTSKNPDLIGIRFTAINTTYIEGGEPSEQEGGPLYGLISIRYDYVSHRQQKQFDEATGTWLT